MAKLTLEEWLARAEKDRRFMENVRAIRKIPARPGEFAEYPEWVHPSLRKVLAERGIGRLYSHQAKAVDLVRKGQSVVLVTPTASGKTLCYNLPVLQKILEEPETRALYLFPTKALAQDQMHEIHGLIGEMKADIKTYTYDGDTPDDARQAIRRQGHVVVTNPDMLHAGILPHHTKWQKLFANLQYVVIDELHVYRGVFGSHLTNVLRRLVRICRFYGRDPVFICCSATVANPREHAERLLERSVALIAESGAPAAAKTFILYNPPIVNRELGIRQSALTPVRKMAAELIENGIQTIVFATSRLNVEVLTKYLKDQFAKGKPVDTQFVTGYRGRISPQPPPADRGGPAQPGGDGGRGDQRPGAGDRHRRSGGGDPLRLSRLHRQHLAAGGPGRQAHGPEPGHPHRPELAARSVHRGEPRLLLLPLAGVLPGQPGQPPDPACTTSRAPPSSSPSRRGRTSAGKTWRSSSTTSRRRGCCTASTPAGTGRRRAIPPTR